jgi:hypothetical protein
MRITILISDYFENSVKVGRKTETNKKFRKFNLREERGLTTKCEKTLPELALCSCYILMADTSSIILK